MSNFSLGDKFKSLKAYNAISILFVLNLLNYIDRYTLAGVLSEVQEYYSINDAQAGLLQTLFICTYTIVAPLFGYLGDRYNRKYIIIFGVTFWCTTTLCGSFVPRHMFWLFAWFRSLVGVGEASYSCVAPTIIGDLYKGEMRTRMLAVFIFAIPVGCGLGFILGASISTAFSDWRWALRVTPALGILSLLLLIIFVDEPERGKSEGMDKILSTTTFSSDILYLVKNKTFMLATFGFTFAQFLSGGLSWWVPTFIGYALKSKVPTESEQTNDQISFSFGVVTLVCGLLGVFITSMIIPSLRRHLRQRADPLVCAFGSILSVPLLFIVLYLPRIISIYLIWFIIGIIITGLALAWTLYADMTLYVVQPTRRSTAQAVSTVTCHVLGDAISPYIIGAISDAIRGSRSNTYFNRFASLQDALLMGPVFAALSFSAYLFASIYVIGDKKKVEQFIKSKISNIRKNKFSFIKI